MNNNIDNLVFQNHDTYVYYSAPLLNSEHRLTLPPVNQDPDIVFYSSYITDLYVNGNKNGTFKVNRFTREEFNDKLTIVTFIATITTEYGTLMINYAGNIITSNDLYALGQNFITYATYKSGIYAKYLNVKVSINVPEFDYRVITISY